MERREALKFFNVCGISVIGGGVKSIESPRKENPPVKECPKHKEKKEPDSANFVLSSWQSNKISFYWKDPVTDETHKHTYCLYCWLEKMVEAADELQVTKIA